MKKRKRKVENAKNGIMINNFREKGKTREREESKKIREKKKKKKVKYQKMTTEIIRQRKKQ